LCYYPDFQFSIFNFQFKLMLQKYKESPDKIVTFLLSFFSSYKPYQVNHLSATCPLFVRFKGGQILDNNRTTGLVGSLPFYFFVIVQHFFKIVVK